MEGTTDLQKEVQPGAPTQVRGGPLLPDGRDAAVQTGDGPLRADTDLRKEVPLASTDLGGYGLRKEVAPTAS